MPQPWEIQYAPAEHTAQPKPWEQSYATPTPEPEGDELSRAVKTLPGGGVPQQGPIDRYLERSGISGIGHLLLHPGSIGDAAKAAVQPGVDVVNLVRQGKYGEAGNKVGELAGNMIPGVAPAGDIINDIAKGEYRNIAPDFAAGLTQAMLPKFAGRQATRTAARAVEKGATEIPSLLGRGEVGEATRRAGKFIVPDILQDNTSPLKRLTEAYAPTNALKFGDDLKRAMPAVKEITPKVDFDGLPGAIQTAKYQTGEKFNTYMDRAEGMGLHVDGNTIADRILAAVPDKFRDLNQEGYKSLVDGLSPYRRNLSPRELKSYLETTNDQLANFYKALPDPAATKLGASAHIATLDAEADALRDNLYNKIDPETGGENVRELQRRMGSLMSLDTEHERFTNRVAKTPLPTPMQKVRNVVESVPGLNLATKATLKKLTPTEEGSLKMGGDIGKINRALKDYTPGPGQGYNVPVPDAGPFPMDLNPPPGEPAFVRQRGLGEVEPLVPRSAPFEEEPIPRSQLNLTSPGNGPTPIQPSLSEFQPQTRPELKPFKKYPWEEAEQPPPLEMRRPPAEADAFQRLLFPAQPEGPQPGQMRGRVPGVSVFPEEWLPKEP